MEDVKSYDFDDDSYEAKRIRNTRDLWKLRDQLQEKSDSLFTSNVKIKAQQKEKLERILPRFDQSDSESDQELDAPDKNLPIIVVVDESAKPVADGDKAEQKKSAKPVADGNKPKQKKEPAKNVCFHKFRFSLFSHRSNSIVVAHVYTC